MLRCWIFLMLVLASYAGADDAEVNVSEYYKSPQDMLPDQLIEGCVDVISGSVYWRYDGILAQLPSGETIDCGFVFDNGLFLYRSPEPALWTLQAKATAFQAEKNSDGYSNIYFPLAAKAWRFFPSGGKEPLSEKFNPYIVNTTHGSIGGQSDAYNQWLDCSNGVQNPIFGTGGFEKWVYRDGLLQTQTLNDGTVLHAEFNKEKDLVKIGTKSVFLTIERTVDKAKNTLYVKVQNNRGQWVRYAAQRFINRIDFYDGRWQEFSYDPSPAGGYRLRKVLWSDGRMLELKYNGAGKVILIVGHEGWTYAFYYGKRDREGNIITIVRDYTNNYRFFKYNGRVDGSLRLNWIDYHNYVNTTSTKIIKKERFIWGRKGRLAAKAICDGDGVFQSAITYTYDDDDRGNVISQRFVGALTGKVEPRFSVDKEGHLQGTYECDEKQFLYNDANQLIREKDELLETHYEYLPSTNLVTKKKLFEAKTLFEEHVYSYDTDGFCLFHKLEHPQMHIATYERFEPVKECNAFGKPRIKIEGYYDGKNEVPLTKHFYSYDAFGNEISDTVYIWQYGNFYEQYTTHARYNRDTQTLAETIDPRGAKTEYFYNEKHQVIEKRGPALLSESASCISYAYTKDGRLSQESLDGIATTEYFYDKLGRLVKKKLPTGAFVHTVYDVCNQKISESLFKTWQYTYDALGNKTKTQDPHGSIFTARYNARGQPLFEQAPDGGLIQYTYDLKGLLVEKRDEYIHRYFYNGQRKRILEQSISGNGEVKCVEASVYCGAFLIEQKKPSNPLQCFFYDMAGRVEFCQEGERYIKMSYDVFGRLISRETELFCERFFYDASNNKVCHEVGDDCANTLLRRSYAYNGKNQCVKEETCNGVKMTAYNHFDLPLEEVDFDGRLTRHTYRFFEGLEKRKYDPNGICTLEHCDHDGKLLRKLISDASGKTLFDLTCHYDALRNCTEQIYRYEGGVFSLSFTYDICGRCLTKTVGNTTKRFEYDAFGHITKITLPSGIAQKYVYDGFGRLKVVNASGACYSYTYDDADRPIEAVNHLSGGLTKRVYDEFGNLVKEVFESGYSVESTYDSLNRKMTLTAPYDKTCTFSYDGVFLRKAGLSAGSQTLSREFLRYDTDGNLLKTDSAHYAVDPCHRKTRIEERAYTASLSYNSLGLLEKVAGTFPQEYRYNGRRQLVEEKGTFSATYNVDAIDCRRQKNDQEFHFGLQLELLGNYRYNSDGQCIFCNGFDLTYDGLGQLILARCNDKEIHFSYDPFGRLIQRTAQDSTERYLYDGERQLGWIGHGTPTVFRMLHPNATSEQGASLAISIRDTVAVPSHNERGDIIAIGNEVHFLSAFGRDPFPNFPWSYAGKRYDRDLKAFDFGKRFYLPETGRFLTVDPTDFDDGPNRYAYAHHSPTLYFDAYGLSSEFYDARQNLYDRSYFDYVDESRKTVAKFAEGGSSHNFISTNGICCSKKSLFEMVTDDIQVRPDANHYYVARDCRGFVKDVLEACVAIVAGPFGYQTQTAKNITHTMNRILEDNPQAMIQLLGHSFGVVNIRMALCSIPLDLRQKHVDAAGFAPPLGIPDFLCRESRLFAHPLDPVSVFARLSSWKNMQMMHRLPSDGYNVHALSSDFLKTQRVLIMQRFR